MKKWNGDHLNETVRDALNLPTEKRIAFVRNERWIGYQRALDILETLEELFTHPKTHRMPNLLIVGDTNNGKTMIVNRFQSKHPAFDNPEGDAICLPVMIAQAPPVPDEGRFYDEILSKLNAPFKEKDKPSKKYFQVIRICKQIKLIILIIDEIQDILAGGLQLQRNFRNAVKHLGNDLQIPIVGVGTYEAFNALQADSQTANRFKPVFLPRWKIDEKAKPEDDPYLRLLSSFERMLPLKEPSNLSETTIALKLLSMSEGLIGELSEILRLAAVRAIRTKKEKIDVQLLDEIRWVQPSNRKWGRS